MTTAIANTPAAWSARAESESPLEAVGWSQEGQAERFAAVLDALQLRARETVLDFGCGTGALCETLPKKVEYVGYDWAPGMVLRARDEHPEREFTIELPARSFDVIACIGPFNLPAGWTKAMTWATIRSLWASCRRALAVSLYAGTDARCLRYEPGQVLAFAQSTAPLWSVTRHRVNDLLLVLRR